jgi:hypothetical protein
MQPALDPAGHWVPRTKPTFLLHTWRPHRRRPFVLVLHLHQHQSSRNLHLQYLAKNQFTQRCQSLITQGRDHPPVLKPHMVLSRSMGTTTPSRTCSAASSCRNSTGAPPPLVDRDGLRAPPPPDEIRPHPFTSNRGEHFPATHSSSSSFSTSRPSS